MFHAWFSDSVGIVTFVLAVVTVGAAAAAVRFVTRRYVTRASVVVAFGVLGASLLLPWLSHGAADTSSSPVHPLPTVSAEKFVHGLDHGGVRAVAALPNDVALPGATVFEMRSGRWEQAVVPARALDARQRARVARLDLVSVPTAVSSRVEGPRNDALVGFLVVELLSLVAGSMAMLSASGVPRRVDLDEALVKLVAEYHGHETV